MSRPARSSRPDVGRAAEAFCEARLVNEGWEVLDRRWRGARGELDLVARREGQIRFVEVKARDPQDLSGLESIDGQKQARLIGAAEAWTFANPRVVGEFGFLVGLVTLHPAGWTVEWVDDAF